MGITDRALRTKSSSVSSGLFFVKRDKGTGVGLPIMFGFSEELVGAISSAKLKTNGAAFNFLAVARDELGRLARQDN